VTLSNTVLTSRRRKRRVEPLHRELVVLEAKAEEERVAKLQAEAKLHDALKEAEARALEKAKSDPAVLRAKAALEAAVK
jgi:hypothetical protein